MNKRDEDNGVLEVLREQWCLMIRDNKKFLDARGFFIGNSKDEGRCITYGKR